MKYKPLTILGILASFNIQAGIYTLDNSSSFNNSNGISQLTGSLSLDFSLGLPPLPGNNPIYFINSLNLNANNTLITQTNNINEAPAYPIATMYSLWYDTIHLDSQYNISNLYAVILSLTETTLGTNLYQYNEQILEPVNINNTSYNSVTVGNNLLPSNLLLTYEWHSIVVNALPATYPPGVIGTYWKFNTLSDTNNGTITISAQPAAVPLPTSIWLFVSAVAGMIGFNRRNDQRGQYQLYYILVTN